jgi:hypothetical protein
MNEAQARFHVLGSVVQVLGPESWVATLTTAYERFQVDADKPQQQETFIRYKPGDGFVTLGDRRATWLDEFDGPTQLYNHFLTAVLDGIPAHAVLHAAALVDREDRAFLLAAPSGCGKSSLTLGLLERGYRFLSDDAAPLDTETGTIAPYPRRLALRHGGSAPFSRQVRSRLDSPDAVHWLDKVLIDPADIMGEPAIAKTPKPLAHIFLLGSSTTANNQEIRQFVFVANRDTRSRWHNALENQAQVQWKEDRIDGDGWLARIDYTDNPDVIEILDRIADDPSTVFSQKVYESTPDFTASPKLIDLPIRETAMQLSREWLNRRSRSTYLANLPGGLVEGFFHLTTGLAAAKAHRLQVGKFEETLNILETCLED